MPTDFLRSFELDQRTGDIVLDSEGKPNVLEGNENFMQCMHILLTTQKGEDLLLPEFGFDRLGIFMNEYDQDPILMTELNIKDALNSTKDDRIYGIQSIVVWREKEDLKATVVIRNVNSVDSYVMLGVTGE